MTSYQISETIGADMQPRYYVNGKRESADYVRWMKTQCDRLDCFQTKGRQMPGGKIRRTNYCVATFL